MSADTNSYAGNVLILGIEQQVWIFIKHPQMAWWDKLSPNQFKVTRVKSVFFWQLGSCSYIFSEVCALQRRFLTSLGWRRLWWLIHRCSSILESAGVVFTVTEASCIHLLLVPAVCTYPKLQMNEWCILGWPKSSFGFFSMNKFIGQVNIFHLVP